MDDILVFGKDAAEHDRRLNQVMERFRKAGVALNSKKCKFAVNKLIYLGGVIASKGIHADSAKLAAILEMEEPEAKELFKYLGSVLQVDRGVEAEISRRIRSGWNNWKKMAGVIFDRKIPTRVNAKIYEL